VISRRWYHTALVSRFHCPIKQNGRAKAPGRHQLKP
jgi:hypothetical protein